MKFLLVVFFLFDGQWVQGDARKGWGSVSYESQAACLASKARAEAIHADLRKVNSRAIEKRFECISESTNFAK
ncbi:MAG: hypothetical protein QGG19_16045 [Alphaproteobacteria bacterium]|jgi:hypothetical protein|nr:hypothetical protein [Alphaproteobacteria bacterium]MDP6253887.1 hypothetical protein [Alphaproteobacteria bacterium]MDP7056474.1 hypothetical protein [Alphaproteobacteria bacterium]MDP7230419.1 hypothetical protein [Alphaproteobacteria bacterium]MDP7458997.1 hypothetical protein [Alphaproteobacteria bacterium]|tara:strand:+ start:1729 stop:1947 length:219 start_codon:yes stop_codon:yes gene_type:complete